MASISYQSKYLANYYSHTSKMAQNPLSSVDYKSRRQSLPSESQLEGVCSVCEEDSCVCENQPPSRHKGSCLNCCCVQSKKEKTTEVLATPLPTFKVCMETAAEFTEYNVLQCSLLAIGAKKLILRITLNFATSYRGHKPL